MTERFIPSQSLPEFSVTKTFRAAGGLMKDAFGLKKGGYYE